MSMVVAHNLNAVNVQKNLHITNRAFSNSLAKLSSGYRINSGKDAPADLVISEKLRAQNWGINRAIRNSNEAINTLGIAEGALNEMSEVLKRMRALALHAANDGITSPDQVAADQAEMDSGIQTIDRVAATTKYAEKLLLNGTQAILFGRRTSVDDPMDRGLLDLSATRIDQVFKRDSVVTLGFNGVLDSLQADSNLEARKAYFEADGDLADVNINKDELSADQRFLLSGSLGSREFAFSQGTSLGTVVSSINNVSTSTGVEASLIFGSDVTAEAMIDNWIPLLRGPGDVEVYGFDYRANGFQPARVQNVSLAADADERFLAGKNLDGHGRLYVKITEVGGAVPARYDFFKDKDCSMKVGSGYYDGAAHFTAASNSGLNDDDILFTPVTLGVNSAVEGDVFTVALAGLEIDDTGTAYMDTSAMDFQSLQLGTGQSVVVGADLGRNTDENGRLYFRATGDNTSRTIRAYRSEDMGDDSLVAEGTVNLFAGGANIGTVRMDSVTMADGTDSGLQVSLAFVGPASSATETGYIQFENLGMRLHSSEYGSSEEVRVSNLEGSLWGYYDRDETTPPPLYEPTPFHLIAEGESNAQRGGDATVTINGMEMRTDGLELNAATPDLTAHLAFEEGEFGAATIAQVGYDVGGVFSKAGAIRALPEHENPATTTSIVNTYTFATNARHQTDEYVERFDGGMRLQLGEGSGDQERTVFGIQSMMAANLGNLRFTDDWLGDGIETERILSLSDILGGGHASLAVDPLKALSIVDKSIGDVSGLRARIGAYQQTMLTTNVNNLRVHFEKITFTESYIRDTDMAAEMAHYTNNRILTEAGTSMLAQANTNQQLVLGVLQEATS